MRENRPYGSEGGEANAFPTPINREVFSFLRRGAQGPRLTGQLKWKKLQTL